MKNLIFVAVGFLVLACGSQNPGSPGNQSGQEFLVAVSSDEAGNRICANYFVSGSSDAAKKKAARDLLKSSFANTSDTQCVDTGAKGTCTYSQNKNDVTISAVAYSYDKENKADCEKAGGVFK